MGALPQIGLMELFLQNWGLIAPLISVFAGLIVWGIRLEGLVKLNKQENSHLADRLDRQETEIKDKLGKIDARLEIIASSLERVIWRLPRSEGPTE